jgi:hypothetical protein
MIIAIRMANASIAPGGLAAGVLVRQICCRPDRPLAFP